MSPGRVEPYQRALTELRDRICVGTIPPGTRVVAKEVADELGLSPTPVREAMARLAGEGLLVERRGDGFFALTLTAADVEGLYRLALAMLREALSSPRRGRPDVAAALSEQVEADPVRAIERLFSTWVAETQSPILAEKFQLLTCQLGAVRRVEARLFADIVDEARHLIGLAVEPAPNRLPAVEVFHARRLAEATLLAAAVTPSSA